MDVKSEGWVWFVKGTEEDGCFTTKTGAEAFARMMFQDEDPSTRYARIYYRNLWKMEGV